ncbi:MAG: hypothetical protein ACK4NB_06635 [Fimbriimonadales bacterium]
MPTKPKGQPVKRNASVAPMPAAQRRTQPRRRPTPRWGIVFPMSLIVMTLSARIAAVAMLNYETAQLEQLRRETDRVKLNIEKLRGQIAVYTNEVALNRWAEQAGMVRVELQPELTVIGLHAPRTPSAPLAMRPTE